MIAASGAVTRVDGGHARLLRWASVDHTPDGPGRAVLDRLLAELADLGVARVTGLLPDADPTADVLVE